eukprot:6168068-Amphidinium_carterae.1
MRRGVGKNARHIQTCLLWLQECVAANRLLVNKVHTDMNPADVLTKAVPEARTKEVCKVVGQVWLNEAVHLRIRLRWGGVTQGMSTIPPQPLRCELCLLYALLVHEDLCYQTLSA